MRSGSGITATSFTVDTTGLRRSKITPSGTYAGEAYYAYDQARRLIGIYNASGTPTQEFIYLGDSWQVLAVVKAGVIYPVRSDQLGSPNQVLDPSSGTAIWSWNAGGEPWGGQAPNEDRMQTRSISTWTCAFPVKSSITRSGWCTTGSGITIQERAGMCRVIRLGWREGGIRMGMWAVIYLVQSTLMG